MSPESSRLPSLDGLRALCIAFVIFSHLLGARGFPVLPSPSPQFWASVTFLGVRMFFVMSGFLITTILINEIRRTGELSLSRFYVRRVLRIFPVCYAYLICLVVAERFGLLALRRWDVLAFMTFTTNYHRDRSWYTGHVWSLGIEEQFYLVWPLALKVFDQKNLRRICWAAIVLSPVVRVGLYLFAPRIARESVKPTRPLPTSSRPAVCWRSAATSWARKRHT